MLQWENKCIRFLQSHICLLGGVAVFVLSLWVRVGMLPAHTGDLDACLLPWCEALDKYGLGDFLHNKTGNYNVLYTTLLWVIAKLPVAPEIGIKLLSILFDYATAALMMLFVVRFYTGAHKRVWVLAVFALGSMSPLVLMNGAYWAQCDSIYTFFTLLALYKMLHDRYPQAMLWFGVAVAFKLQALFLLPLFLVLYCVKRKFSILLFGMIPAVLWLSGIPAYLSGLPLLTPFFIYFEQTEWYRMLTMNYPNWYILLRGPYEQLHNLGFGVVCVAFVAVCMWLAVKRLHLTAGSILLLGAWICYVCTSFLPGMHERYAYTGEIILLICIVLYRTRRMVLAAGSLYAAILGAYAVYLYYVPPHFEYWLMGLNYIGLFLLTLELVRVIHAENKPDDMTWHENAMAVWQQPGLLVQLSETEPLQDVQLQPAAKLEAEEDAPIEETR